MFHVISKRETDELLEDLGTLRLDDVSKVYGDAIELMIKITKEYRALKYSKKPLFEWILCKRKNGTEFMKLVYYSNEAGGNIEAGRFNMSKSEQVNNDWTIEEIINEIKNY